MVFSSMTFLCVFLPVVFIMYSIMPSLHVKNGLLIIASLLFYAYGEPGYVLLMICSIVMNYLFGRLLDSENERLRRAVVTLAVCVNLGLLFVFKYLDMAFRTVNQISHRAIPMANLALPIGISFFTFQALSYVIDVYRREVETEKNLFHVMLYISFFPQLIAGPIIKYHDIQTQIGSRKTDSREIAEGMRRFILGLAKKVLISNVMAVTADALFAVPADEMNILSAWTAALAYLFQIYFDFSGYSDMAIGMGRIFGFTFQENFRYPYVSQSIQEFWRRWHISLSTWFREYLYIPLGGNRKGTARTCMNLFIVFMATGLWHGASVSFVLWGVYYGIFLIMERLFLGKWLENNRWKWVNHIYTMTVVVFGWMLFRAEHMRFAKRWLMNMITWKRGIYPLRMYADYRLFFWIIVGVLLCGPLQHMFPSLKKRLYRREETDIWDVAIMAAIVFYATMLLVSNTYNPFIYFRF